MFITSIKIQNFINQAHHLFKSTTCSIKFAKVDRETHVRSLISKHLEGLNSQELRDRVYQKIEEDLKV